ncbi:MAG TPA: NAD(P)-dependent oxidoreductase, partial [Anaerolineales bacterium]|nr:NAD(P)-dependent oxidoreductase [Anaerolineales bacterium]
MTEQIEVLITHAFDEDQAARLQSVSPRLKLRIRPVRKAEEIPPDLWKKAEILYTNRTLPTPEQAPELAWIQFHSAGVEFALDAPILQKQDLVATSLSGASVGQVAEYIVMMLLALGRHLPELMDLQRKVEWPRERWERFMPQELANSIVGIVGYGSIGRQTARLLYGLGAQVLATKKDAMHPEDTDYTPEGMGDPRGEYVHRLYPAQALKSMVRECDFVVVTVPLTENTHSLIGDEELAAFKPGAFLVDVSRGG